MPCDFSVTVDDDVLLCSVHDGQFILRYVEEPDEVADVNLVIPVRRWRQFIQTPPAPFYNTFNAMLAHFRDVTVEGDHVKWAQSVGLIEAVLRLARSGLSDAAGQGDSLAPGTIDDRFDVSTITGHYMNFHSRGQQSVLYYEEAGQGRPIVFLHTAGSDSRQYRYVLANAKLQEQWHMFAFDLPFHGRSDPGPKWWETKYLLTTETYSDWVRDFVKHLELHRPVIVGSSMAGALVLYLAAEYGTEFSAAISLEGGFGTKGRYVPWTNHPMVHPGFFLQSWVRGLMAPQSPEEWQRLTLWQYAQGGPGVYQGDTYFYSVDWLKAGRHVGPAKCPLWILTGEYDYSCTPEDGREAADRLVGIFIEMKGVGHFSMSENPLLFLRYISPILEEILNSEW